jgi:DNA-binding GntR family transcriptional regulator
MMTIYAMGRKPKIPDASTPSIRQRAYLFIHRKVASGELKAGSAISELNLAKELGSSRTPVREAISQLIAEGILEQLHGGGVFVVQLSREDILDICELREALESYALNKVARLGLMRPADKERLAKMVDAVLMLRNELEQSGKSSLDTEQMHRFISTDFSFHAMLICLSQNVRIHRTVNETRLLMRIFSMRTQGHTVEDLDRIYKQHKELMESVARQDVSATAKILSLHLQVSQKERLEECDQHKHEAAMNNIMPAFLSMFDPIVP